MSLLPSATGRCLCGRYQFQLNAEPLWVAYCHCESCRRCNGSPVATYVGVDEQTLIFSPSPPPTFASSPGVKRSFCEVCSTPLAYEADGYPGEVHLFRSNFQEPDRFSPTRHGAVDDGEAGFEIYDDLPRYGSSGFSGFGPRAAIRVLFLCKGNSARGILAEAILNLQNAHSGERRIRASSAGSQPTGVVHPEALTLLEPYRHLLDRPRSQSWDDFNGVRTAPPAFDRVITLCDSAAAESCPAFAGPAQRDHWGLPDPASGAATFGDTWRVLEKRIRLMLQDLEPDDLEPDILEPDILEPDRGSGSS